MFEPKTYHFRIGHTCLSQEHIIFEEEINVSAKNISFSNRKYMFQPKTYHFRKGNTCLSQEHIIFEKEIHVSAKTYHFRKGNTCFGFCGPARPGPAFTKIDFCARGAKINFAVRPGPARLLPKLKFAPGAQI